MPDPLSLLAEKEVPVKTNFFDPRQSQDILSRYGSARRRFSAEEEVQGFDAKKQSMEAQKQEMGLREKQSKWQDILHGREDEEYQARKSAEANQGAFIDAIGQLPHDDPDAFDEQLGTLLEGTPRPVLEEPVTKAYLGFKIQRAEEVRRNKAASQSRDESFNNTMARLRESNEFKTALKGATPETFKRHTNPETGEVDLNAVASETYQAEQLRKRADWDYKARAVQEGRMKLADKLSLSKSARSLRDDLETYIEDPDAFPRHSAAVLSEFRKTNPNATPDMMTGEWADKMAQAQAWDKKPFERELLAAQSYDDPMEYVKLGGEKLTDKQKGYRQKMWQLAHKEDVFEETAPAAKTPKEKKTLSPEARADILKRANGDPSKAMRLAEEEGY